MTSYDVKTNKKWHHLIDQAHGYRSNQCNFYCIYVCSWAIVFVLIFDQFKFISLYLSRTETRRARGWGECIHLHPRAFLSRWGYV